jgi:L-fuconolactonase
MRVIDTHAHVWSLGSPWMFWLPQEPFFVPGLLHDYSFEQLIGELDANRVESVVLMQAGCDVAETTWFLELATSDRVSGVVGWVTLSDPDETRRQLDSFGDNPKLVGIRHNSGWVPDGEVLLEGRADDSARVLAERGLVFDVHMPNYRTLGAVYDFIARIPELTVMVNHLGKPDLTDPDSFAVWAAGTARIATLPNAVIKYSGWSTRIEFPDPKRLQPYAEHLLEHFGDERLVFASNWPVALMSGSYDEVLQASIAALPGLEPSAAERIFAGNAERVYGLNRKG